MSCCTRCYSPALPGTLCQACRDVDAQAGKGTTEQLQQLSQADFRKLAEQLRDDTAEYAGDSL
jgi:hypothetical protein